MSEARTCVITGAAGAVGTALVAYLAGRGYKIAALGRAGDADRLAKLREPGRVLPLTVDVASTSEWTSALATIERELGAPSAAVLVAGGWQGGKALQQEPDDVWQAMLAMNLETARASLKALLAGMVQRRGGSVVLFGSRAAVRPWESANAASYAATKAAVLAFAQAAAADVSRHGVRVNVVLPSTIDTPQNRAAMPDADFSSWVTTDSLSGVIEFLLSDAARDVSGAALPVYGRA
jgi:NAD(P)-dependent dehydrogenase (short-subunit alcohol dehydrogenase family)